MSPARWRGFPGCRRYSHTRYDGQAGSRSGTFCQGQAPASLHEEPVHRMQTRFQVQICSMVFAIVPQVCKPAHLLAGSLVLGTECDSQTSPNSPISFGLAISSFIRRSFTALKGSPGLAAEASANRAFDLLAADSFWVTVASFMTETNQASAARCLTRSAKAPKKAARMPLSWSMCHQRM